MVETRASVLMSSVGETIVREQVEFLEGLNEPRFNHEVC